MIAISPGDLRKKHGEKMQFLGRVWDWSENEIEQWYPLCKAEATDSESKRAIPLYFSLPSFSSISINFVFFVSLGMEP